MRNRVDFKKALPLRTGKDRALGVAHGKRSYDLPLKNNAGNRFLVLLVALMTFLAVLMAASFFVLLALGERWTSGLENQMTIEIPSEDHAGNILTNNVLKNKVEKITTVLDHYPSIESFNVLPDQEIIDLVSPWLGDDIVLEDFPLPALISVKMKPGNEDEIDILRGKIKIAVPHARIDTHETWLNDILRLTKSLRFATLVLCFFVALTATMAIAGAIRSRMAEYHEEIDLLHLMGASDQYISGQFQRHTLILAIKGSAIGLALAFLAMLVIKLIAGDTVTGLIPDFRMVWQDYATICTIPLLVGGLAIITTQKTVLHVLRQLP